jgi:Tfp pilus assembly protein PilF
MRRLVTDESSKKAKKGKGKKEEAKEKDADKTAQETPAEGTGYTVEMKKAVAVVYNTLGMIYLAKKNYTEAIKNFTVAVENDPTLFEAAQSGRGFTQIPQLRHSGRKLQGCAQGQASQL